MGEQLAVRACIFDVFGTVVDWRTSIVRELDAFFARIGVDHVDSTAFAVEWRRLYPKSTAPIRSGEREWVNLDVLHRENLVTLVGEFGLGDVDDRELDHLTRAWHRLDPWPDSVPGLTRLKTRYIVAPCSNGHIALMVNMAKRAGLPWDTILGAEIARSYKGAPEVYLGSCRALDLRPDEVLMVAAHVKDLASAKACGLQTAFVPRPDEGPPSEYASPPVDPAVVDLEADDFVDLAERLGC